MLFRALEYHTLILVGDLFLKGTILKSKFILFSLFTSKLRVSLV